MILGNPIDCSPHTPLSMEFSRQEYWNGLLFPTPGALSNLGIKSRFLVSLALAGGFFTTSTTWETYACHTFVQFHRVSNAKSES